MATVVDDEALAAREDHTQQLPRLAPKLAVTVLVTVFLGFCTVASMGIFQAVADTMSRVLALLLMAGLLVLQLGYFSRPHVRMQPPVSYLALAGQALLVFLPFLIYGQPWVGMPGFLAGSLLLALPPLPAGIGFALVVASMAWFQSAETGQLQQVVYTATTTIITGLMVFGLSRLAAMVYELHAARRELAKMAVAKERLRFARDLHDLLGLSLSAITLKSELTSRLMNDQPTRAKEELAGILAISRQALADVRSVASGYREISLPDECKSTQAVLAAADVEVAFRTDLGELPAIVGTVLATVLREGVTNVLRHSKAEHCEITIRQLPDHVYLDIVNDGVTVRGGEPARGRGIENLSERLRSVGGELRIELTSDDKFWLHASVPLGDDENVSATANRPLWRSGWRRRGSAR